MEIVTYWLNMGQNHPREFLGTFLCTVTNFLLNLDQKIYFPLFVANISSLLFSIIKYMPANSYEWKKKLCKSTTKILWNTFLRSQLEETQAWTSHLHCKKPFVVLWKIQSLRSVTKHEKRLTYQVLKTSHQSLSFCILCNFHWKFWYLGQTSLTASRR